MAMTPNEAEPKQPTATEPKWKLDDFNGSDTMAISWCQAPGVYALQPLGRKSETPTGAKEAMARELIADANLGASLRAAWKEWGLADADVDLDKLDGMVKS